MRRKINIILSICLIGTLSLVSLYNSNTKEIILNNVESTTLYTDGESFNDGTLKYTIISEVDKTVSLDGFLVRPTEAVDLEIPKQVEKQGQMYKVISIAEEAFENRLISNKVTIPNTIIEIGSYAFGGLNVPIFFEENSNLQIIGTQAFVNSHITAIELPSSLVSIGENAFIGCNKLNTIYLNNIPNDSISKELNRLTTEIEGNLLLLPLDKLINEVKNLFVDNTKITVTYELTLTLDLDGGNGVKSLQLLQGLYGYEKNSSNAWVYNPVFELPTPTKTENDEFSKYLTIDNKEVDQNYLESLTEDTTIFAKYNTKISNLTYNNINMTIEVTDGSWIAYNEELILTQGEEDDFNFITSDIIEHMFSLTTDSLESRTYLISIDVNLKSSETYKLYVNGYEVNYNYDNNVLTFETNELGGIAIVAEGVYFFDTINKEISLNKAYKGNIENLVIPNTFEFLGNTYEVKGIAISGFDFSDIKSIVLPESLESIGANAFSSVVFTKLIIPSKVTVIGEDAFSGCTEESNIIMLASITSDSINALTSTSAVVITTKEIYEQSIDLSSTKIAYEVVITLDFDGGNSNGQSIYTKLFNYPSHKLVDGIWTSFDTEEFTIPTKGENYKFEHYKLNDEVVDYSYNFSESVTIIACYKTNKFVFDNVTISTPNSWFELNEELQFQINNNISENYLLTSDIVEFAFSVTSNLSTYNLGAYLIEINFDFELNETYKIYLNGLEVLSNDFTFTTDILGDVVIVKEGVFGFDIDSNEIYLNELYNGDINHLVIPESFKYNEVTYNVTSIKPNSFNSNEILSIVIPQTITSIPENTFDELTFIYMNASLTEANLLGLNNNVVIVDKDNYEDGILDKLTYEINITFNLNTTGVQNVVTKRLFKLNDYSYKNDIWVHEAFAFYIPDTTNTNKFSHYELNDEIVSVDTLLTSDATLTAIYFTNTIEVAGDIDITIYSDDWFDLNTDINITTISSSKYDQFLNKTDIIHSIYRFDVTSRSASAMNYTIHMDLELSNGNYNIFVIKNGELTKIETLYENGTLKFGVDELTEFAVVKVAKVYFFTNYTNTEWFLVISILVLTIYNIIAFAFITTLKKKTKNVKLSSTLIPLLFITVNPILVMIISAYFLVVVALLQTGYIIYKVLKNKKETNKEIDEVEELPLPQIEDEVIEEEEKELVLKEVESKRNFDEVENEVLQEVKEEVKEEAKEEAKEETKEVIDESIEIIDEIVADEREILSVNDFSDEEDEEETEDDIETEVEEDPNELVKAKKDEEGKMIIIRYKKSYSAKLNMSDDNLKDIHNLIKNKLLSFKKVKSRTSWNHDAFNLGRVQAAKLNVRGKSLFLYLPIDPKEYEDSKYTFKDCSDIKKYEQLPFRIKLKSSRSIKYACELIDMAMTDLETTEIKEFENVNYYQKNRGFDKLLEEGLIKEIIDAETFKELKEINKEFLDSNKIKSIDLDVIKDIKINDSIYKEVVSNISAKGSARDVINVDTISKSFEDGEVVSLKTLKAKKLISANSKGVKCLARGTLDKCLTFELQAYSKDAVKMILITNGKII